MKVSEIKALLDEQGIEYPASAKKVDLEALLPAEESVPEVIEEEAIVEETVEEAVEVRLHEKKVVSSSEIFDLNGHKVERLNFLDGSSTIIPAE